MKIKTTNKFTKLVKDNKGATMVEYGLMLALILVLAFAGFKTLGGKVKSAGVDSTNAFQ
jgi:Flp pilus assembly pilin Flp